MKNDMKAAVSPMEMDVRIFPYRGDGPVAAIASVTEAQKSPAPEGQEENGPTMAM